MKTVRGGRRLIALGSDCLAERRHADCVRRRRLRPAWEQLTPEQQQTLSPYRQQWDRLPPQQREDLARGAERWQDMTPEQRERAKRRIKQWQNLAPEDRERVRERYSEFKQMPPGRTAARTRGVPALSRHAARAARGTA